MDAKQVIVAVLKPVRHIGLTLQIYYCNWSNPNFMSVIEPLSADNISTDHEEGIWQLKLVELSKNLDPREIAKRFSKDNLSTNDFFAKLEQKVLEKVVKPFIWKNLDQMIQILSTHTVPFYSSKSWPNIYPEERIYFKNESPRMQLRFNRTEIGTHYTLEVWLGEEMINLQNPDYIILTHEPCYFIAGDRMLRFEDNISGKLLIPFRKKDTIEIPQRIEKDYYSRFIKKIASNADIEAIGFRIIDLDLHPKAKLSMERDYRGLYGLVLSFDYVERELLANNPQQTFTTLLMDDEGFVFKRFKRNPIWELQQIEKLQKAGLQLQGSFFSFISSDDRSQHAGFVSFMMDHASVFESWGFEIMQKDQQKFVLEKPRMNVKKSDINDWFDLQITIVVGNYSFPFTALHPYILRGEKIFPLPQGNYFLIPEVWFERYTGILIHGHVMDDTLRLDKHHFKLLHDFEIPKVIELENNENINEVPQLPDLHQVTLRTYQEFGFYWMHRLLRNGFGAILADDMGLGKTLQVIAVLSDYYKNQKGHSKDKSKVGELSSEKGNVQLSLFEAIEIVSSQVVKEDKLPALIVIPTSVVHNWKNELKRFAPFLRVMDYTGTGRKFSSRKWTGAELILTTYGTLRNDIEMLREISFSFIILDESQNIKNHNSKTAQAAYLLKAKNRIILTGTPIENRLTDLWSQMNFVNPGLLGGLADFNHYYATPIYKNPETPQTRKLIEMISPFILRRTKRQVAPELPLLTETVVYCEMGEAQKKLYEAEKSRLRNFLLEGLTEVSDRNENAIMVLKALMRLRQFANHPKMADKSLDADSGKFEAVTDRLETLIAENHKVLVFSSFVSHLVLVEEFCQKNDIDYAMLTGSTRNREEVVDTFRKGDKVKVFLISLKAGGVGLNLVEAGYVFLLDPWWNPAAESQAISRSHRIGQEKNVFVYRFISKGSIEEKILKLQQNKKQLADDFIIEEKYLSTLSREEMLKLLM